MNPSRRRFLYRGAGSGLVAALLPQQVLAAQKPGPAAVALPPFQPMPPGLPGVDYRPVETPNGSTLPFRIVDGIKVFHLIAQPVRHEFAPGLQANCWGYNGSVHGPTIEAVEGDQVRIYVTNQLDEPTTVHWHGLLLPNGMDGVGGLTQRSIEPGETFVYEFPLRQHGTFMYHSHHDEMVQMAMGMMGLIVIHPRNPPGPLPDRDFAYMLSEWAMVVGTERPNVNEMTDFNVLTFNGKVFPATAPMVAKTGERVRLRIGNLSAMDHHPIHLHGFVFEVTETDGGVVPPTARWPETTVLVPTGSTRTVEFTADAPGDWAMHCHMTHHVMTQMGHDVPNLNSVDPSLFDQRLAEVLPDFPHLPRYAKTDPPEIDEDPLPRNSQPMVGGVGGFGYITMGGMVTVLKVRDQLDSYADPGWYSHPPGTVAGPADPDAMQRDGISG